MPLDLLLPDLLLPHDAPAPLRELRLPALERWLARADFARSPSRGTVGTLATLYGLAQPAPVAAISLAAENGIPAAAAPAGGWLRADPVHLRIDHDYVRLHDASILDVTREEAKELVRALREHFAADGLEFHVGAGDRWYVRVPEGELPTTRPLPEAVGRDVFGALPQGGGRINWRSAITEAQMVMSPHAVNTQREEAGKPAINSVWFWGEGAAPASVDRRYALVAADDAFARGLATLSAAEVRALPKRLAEVDLVREADTALAVVDTLTAPLRRGDLEAWKREAERLDDQWFATLGDALQRFGAVRLILPTDKETRVATLTPAARWRWFRSRKPLAAHA